MSNLKSIRIAIVAGEASGDILGANLMEHLLRKYPNATFEGIGGKLMTEKGIKNFEDMERLSVMGLVEVLGRLRELLKLRKSLVKRWLQNPPDVFIGIDAPDFNLGLEESLRQNGIKTVHYVSPSVWAWRQKRVFKIARAVDLMLALFPFEAKFYKNHNVKVECVGHTLADQIPMETDVGLARKELTLATEQRIVAVLPGSRGSEVSQLMPVFAETMAILHKKYPEIRFVIPAANAARAEQIKQILANYNSLPIELVLGQSRTVMAAADAILIASGTATLEATLLKKPMVVAYKVNWLSAFIFRRMLVQEFVALPNLLAGKEIVPERLQELATPEILSKEMIRYLEDGERVNELKDEFEKIHHSIRLNAGETASEAIFALLENN